MKKIKTAPYVPTEFSVTKDGEDKARFEIYPFEPGYAITLAHPIKRLILSSTVGFAPTAIKIDGAVHEFDSIRGVVEDVARMIVNLKNIRFKITSDEDRVELALNLKGPKEVKGADFAAKGVEVVTPDAHFASINEDGELKMSVIIEKGMGYVPSEELMDYVPEGYLALDAIFGTVKRANYTIEKMLVDDNPNYEKIIFDVASFGQVDPVTIFEQGVATMFKQLELFTSVFGVKSKTPVVKSKESDDALKEYLVKIEDLNLSARSHHCLDYSKIVYLGEILLMGENEIAKIKNLGKKSLDEIKEKLEEIGYPIQNGVPEPIASRLREKLEELKG